jgi:hypothetical protein
VKKEHKNVAASVLARLLTGAQERKEDFNLTLQRYAAERFLFRLGTSRHREQFVLKGAMLLALWGGSLYRATRDLDLTGYTEDNPRTLIPIIQEICALPCPDDGLEFLPATVRAEPIRDESEYHGFRVKLQAMLEAARVNLQIDVGLGNAIEPPAQEQEYPVLLDSPTPRIRAYPREAVIAEKFHAMVVLGAANTRYKDFYDVFVLARHFSFSGPVLARAIAATFERRRTSMPNAQPVALAPAFYSDAKRAAEWQRYLSRNGLPGAPADFAVIGEILQSFLGPIWSARAAKRAFSEIWAPAGPWTPSTQNDEVRA